MASLHVCKRYGLGWAVRRRGAARAWRTFARKADAVRSARAARGQAPLYIHSADGSVQRVVGAR